MDYAGACSAERDGRCFRFVYDDFGKPARCEQPLTATGWTRLDRWYAVDSCTEHAAQLHKPGPYQASTADH